MRKTGSAWHNVNIEKNRKYLKNAYRVLLTRARQGFVIFVPEGDNNDETCKSEFYNGIYYYLKELGVKEI